MALLVPCSCNRDTSLFLLSHCSAITADSYSETIAANAAANLAAFRSGVCPDCDKSSPTFVKHSSRKRDFFRVGGKLSEAGPSSPAACRHTPRSHMRSSNIIQWLVVLLESQDAAVISAVLIALYNISASEVLVDAISSTAEGSLQHRLLEVLSWPILSDRSKDAARMILQRLDLRDMHENPNFTFMSAFCLPPPRTAVYIEP